jgi:hypothetical protein
MTMIDYMIQNAKEENGEPKKLAFLYDIGCHTEKGVICVRISPLFIFAHANY